MSPNELASLNKSLHEINSVQSIDVSYNASLTSDISRFEASLQMAAAAPTNDGAMQIAKAALEPLNSLNAEASELAGFASNAASDGDGFTPSEIVTLTYKAQEFGFHSQLTANIANRLSDGIQQLFRQQG